MGKIIAVTNQKGGVGKTTTSINIAASLAYYKYRVLLIDADPQGNATMGSGIDKYQLNYTLNEVLLGSASIAQAIQMAHGDFAVLPANGDLTEAEVTLLKESGKETMLRKLLLPLVSNYDYCLIDCPPSLNMLTINSLVAANSVIIPIQCEYYALEGLAALLDTIEQVRSSLNPSLAIEGVVRTMYDARNRLTNEVSKELVEHFADKVYQTVIPRNVRLAEAPSYGLPAHLYDRQSPGANAYLALAKEMTQGEVQRGTTTQATMQTAVVD